VEDVLTRFWTNVLDRVHGPLMFRFLLQPTVAVLYAVRDGVTDAREGRPAYLRAILTRPDERNRLLREGSAAVGRVLVLGTVMELIYQVIVLRWVYPGELIFIVLLLAFVPYLLARGPVNRLAHAWLSRRSTLR
jgi:hypothetical protein